MLTVEVMGTLVFIVGLILLIAGVMSIAFRVTSIGDLEQFALFLAGVFTCVLGYWMATRPSD